MSMTHNPSSQKAFGTANGKHKPLANMVLAMIRTFMCLKKAAQQLGVAYYTLADWRSIRRNTPPAKTPSAEEQTIRIRELERENAGQRTANNILKDALGFFAQDRKK